MKFILAFITILLLLGFTNLTKIDREAPELRIEKSEYSTTEKVGFWVQAADDLKVETISCSCGDKDFFYTIIKKGKALDVSKIYRRHLEDENSERCACLSQNATLVNSVVYYIEPIKEKGIYYLEIKDKNGSVYTSEEFVVK